MQLKEEIVSLLKKTATELPEDVISELEKAEAKEDNFVSKNILKNILANIDQAKIKSKPICQDTGNPIFYVKCPRDFSQIEIKNIIQEALNIATENVPLRPNAIEVLSDKCIGNKATIYFEESEDLKIDLILKGGGSENISTIYQLPNKEINAYRNLDGVRRCILETILKAQGKGCPPYIIGVAIGGSIEEVAHLSKKQLLRKLDDKNPIEELRLFEEKILDEINQLGIGPMGLGGKTTALAVKVSAGLRHPASFFVGISVNCWCLRRGNI